MKKIIIGFVLLFLVACSNTTPEQIEGLRIGMRQQDVISILGEPYTKEYRTDGCILKYTYYDNGYKHSLYVSIRNNKVDGWF